MRSRDPAFCISHFPFQLSAAWSQSPLRVARTTRWIQPQPKCSIHWNIFHVYFLFQIDQKKKRDMITGAKTNRFKRNNKRNGKRPHRINKNRQRKMFVLLSRNFIPALFFNSKTKKKKTIICLVFLGDQQISPDTSVGSKGREWLGRTIWHIECCVCCCCLINDHLWNEYDVEMWLETIK